jgi:hypothetical protein
MPEWIVEFIYPVVVALAIYFLTFRFADGARTQREDLRNWLSELDCLNEDYWLAGTEDQEQANTEERVKACIEKIYATCEDLESRWIYKVKVHRYKIVALQKTMTGGTFETVNYGPDRDRFREVGKLIREVRIGLNRNEIG